MPKGKTTSNFKIVNQKPQTSLTTAKGPEKKEKKDARPQKRREPSGRGEDFTCCGGGPAATGNPEKRKHTEAPSAGEAVMTVQSSPKPGRGKERREEGALKLS